LNFSYAKGAGDSLFETSKKIILGQFFPMIPRGGEDIADILFFLSMLYVKQHPWSEEFPEYAPLRTFSRWALIFGTPHSSSITLHFMLGD